MLANVNEQMWIDFDLNIAIFLDTIAYWLKKNAVNKQDRNFHNDRYWTYNTIEAYTKMFPGWSTQNIRTIIKNCVKHDLLIVGNFNKKGYDRTGWYSLTDKALEYYAGLMYIAKDNPDTSSFVRSNKPDVGSNKSIPKLLPTRSKIFTKVNTKNLCEFTLEELFADNPHKIPDEYIQQWIKNRKKNKVTKLSWSRVNRALTELCDKGVNPLDAFERMVDAGWRTLEVEYFKQQFSSPATKTHESQWDADSVWNA